MRAIYSEIVTLVIILLVIPAANATSERTFSALRRVKFYLRSTMNEQSYYLTCTQRKNRRSHSDRVHCKKQTTKVRVWKVLISVVYFLN